MTAEEMFALPTNDRLDRRLIGGHLVERAYPFRSPAHASVVAKLIALLGVWQKYGNADWSVFGYGCPYRLAQNPDTVLTFDSSIAPSVLGLRPLPRDFIEGIPTVAIEIIDGSDSRDALVELIDHCANCGVPLLWLIDPVEEYVEVHRRRCGSVILDKDDDLVADFVGPSFRCPVAEIFE